MEAELKKEKEQKKKNTEESDLGIAINAFDKWKLDGKPINTKNNGPNCLRLLQNQSSNFCSQRLRQMQKRRTTIAWQCVLNGSEVLNGSKVSPVGRRGRMRWSMLRLTLLGELDCSNGIGTYILYLSMQFN